jgi:hypothetical protein
MFNYQIIKHESATDVKKIFKIADVVHCGFHKKNIKV